jgi:hypothetical protein
MLSQLALRLLSVILGGYGIFCLIMSFAVPEVGAQAFILLARATMAETITTSPAESDLVAVSSIFRGGPAKGGFGAAGAEGMG